MAVLNATLFRLNLNGIEIPHEVGFDYFNHNRFDEIHLRLLIDDSKNGYASLDNIITPVDSIGSVLDFEIKKSDETIHKGRGILMEQKTSFEIETPVTRHLVIRI